MTLGFKKIDPKLAQDIEEDMAEVDKNQPPKKVATESEKIKTEPCDCTGGPGKNKTPETRGTGLIDDHTLCGRCGGSGVLTAALG